MSQLRRRSDFLVATEYGRNSESTVPGGADKSRAEEKHPRGPGARSQRTQPAHAASAKVNVAVQANVNVDLTQIAERVIKRFDHKPELKARIAQALMKMNKLPAAVRADDCASRGRE